ncbi:MAG TPA: hypothetical protein VMC08_02665, partial [Bacteroidales bacterium]|nr:hypothetical protein [Bacteroidales bacterium]
PPDKGAFKEFRTVVDGKIVNKCFPGLAILWLPFFLIAHLLSRILGFAADGYSLPYQLAIAVAAFFYLWLACRVLIRLLKDLGAGDYLASGIMLLISLGTNLVFFVIVEGSMTHVYSFAMITLFLFCAQRMFQKENPSWFAAAAVLFGLIVIIRPTNGLILLLVPFMAGGWERFKESLRRILTHPAIFSTGVILGLLLLLIPPAIWHIRTGHWLVNSYGGESFEFGRLRFFSILFSFNRGWFVYTPIAFIAIFGFVPLYRISRWRFAWGLIFLTVFIYVASSWWMWYYASKMGQRVFIDIYAFVAILLFYLLNSLQRRKLLFYLLSSILCLLVALNLFQFYQHAKFIFPGTYLTGALYRDSFFSLHPKARAYLPEDAILSHSTCFLDMENNAGGMNPHTFTASQAYRGKQSSRVSAKSPYSAGINAELDPVFRGPNRAIRVTAMILSPEQPPASTLVVDFLARDTTLCYYSFYIDSYLVRNRWTRVETAVYLPANLPPGSRAKIYFYNPSANSPLYIDDMRIDFLTLKNTEEFRHLENVAIPCR